MVIMYSKVSLISYSRLYDGGETEIEKDGEAPDADEKDKSSKENDTPKETKDEQEKTDESSNENSENITNQ